MLRAAVAEQADALALALSLPEGGPLTLTAIRSLGIGTTQQARAVADVLAQKRDDYLVTATPAAGKTRFALRIAHHYLAERAAGRVLVDGLGVGDVGNVVLRDRKHLSEDGLVIIVATVDSKTGKVLAGPDLVSRGFVYVRENESLMDGAQSIVENALDRCVDEHVRDWNSVKTRVREALSSYIYRRTKRSPMILPILMEV